MDSAVINDIIHQEMVSLEAARLDISDLRKEEKKRDVDLQRRLTQEFSNVWRRFRALAKETGTSGKIAKSVIKSLSEKYEKKRVPEKLFIDKVTSQTVRTLWRNEAIKSGVILSFANDVVGPSDPKKAPQNKIIDLLGNVTLGLMTGNTTYYKKLSDAKPKVESWFRNYRMSQVKDEGKQSLRDVGIPEEVIQRFLPEAIEVKLSPSRKIVRFVENYGNKWVSTWEIKAKRAAFLAEHYNDIVKEVKVDLKSSNPDIRIKAIIVSIMMQTGIRPGKGTSNIKDDDGKSISVETFGATSVQKRHVNFIKENVVEIRFLGKAAKENVVHISDSELIKILKKFAENIDGASSDSNFFLTSDGKKISDADIDDYLKSRWGDIVNTVFRKRVSNQKFYEYLQSEWKKRLTSFESEWREHVGAAKSVADGERDRLEKHVVSVIVETLEKAARQTQNELFHKEFKVTVDKYISPKVVLAFLSKGGLHDALDEIILNNEIIEVKFDVYEFLKDAISSIKTSSSGVTFTKKGKHPAKSILEWIEDAEELADKIT